MIHFRKAINEELDKLNDPYDILPDVEHIDTDEVPELVLHRIVVSGSPETDDMSSGSLGGEVPLTKDVEEEPEEKKEKFKGPHAHLSNEQFDELVHWVDTASTSSSVPPEARAELLKFHAGLLKEKGDRLSEGVVNTAFADEKPAKYVPQQAAYKRAVVKLWKNAPNGTMFEFKKLVGTIEELGLQYQIRELSDSNYAEIKEALLLSAWYDDVIVIGDKDKIGIQFVKFMR